MIRVETRTRSLLLAAGLLCSLSGPVCAQEAPTQSANHPEHGDPTSKFVDPPGMPADLKGKALIVDRADGKARLPLDVNLDDEQGNRVKLRDLLPSDRPVLLQFVYFRCPSLCTVALNQTLDVLKRMKFTPGKEFDLLTVSINPQETPNLARGKKARYLEALGRPAAEKGWHFLTGTDANVSRLAGAAGFGYRFNTQTREYAHGAGLFVVTPDGRLSRTIYGAMYEPRTLRFSLLEAAGGRIGSPLDRILLYCYHFDPQTGKYTTAVMNIVRLAGVLSCLIVFSILGTWFWRERKQRLASEAAPAPPATPTTASTAPPASTGGSIQ